MSAWSQGRSQLHPLFRIKFQYLSHSSSVRLAQSWVLVKPLHSVHPLPPPWIMWHCKSGTSLLILVHFCFAPFPPPRDTFLCSERVRILYFTATDYSERAPHWRLCLLPFLYILYVDDLCSLNPGFSGSSGWCLSQNRSLRSSRRMTKAVTWPSLTLEKVRKGVRMVRATLRHLAWDNASVQRNGCIIGTAVILPGYEQPKQMSAGRTAHAWDAILHNKDLQLVRRS